MSLHEIIKNVNFKKMVPQVVPGIPFRTSPGTPTGLNVLLTFKLIHVGSSVTKFDDKIIKTPNFQKMVPNVVPGTPFRTPPGTPMGPNVLLVVNNIYLHHPHPD